MPTPYQGFDWTTIYVYEDCLQVTMDNFEYDAAVAPEPATLLLLGTGLAAARLRRQYRRRA